MDIGVRKWNKRIIYRKKSSANKKKLTNKQVALYQIHSSKAELDLDVEGRSVKSYCFIKVNISFIIHLIQHKSQWHNNYQNLHLISCILHVKNELYNAPSLKIFYKLQQCLLRWKLRTPAMGSELSKQFSECVYNNVII